MNDASIPVLTFTGERYLPSQGGELRLEHVHRYAFAQSLSSGKKVLDIACGEGYGSAMLAQRASEVLGVDVSEESVAHARATYNAANLRFQQGNAAALDLPDQCFDLVVSFETIEHLAEQSEMLQHLRRVLKPDGLLLISSPNKAVYSDLPGNHNEFHVKELYFSEFDALLRGRFAHILYLTQRFEIFSVLEPSPNSEHSIEALADYEVDSTSQQQATESGKYFVALCSAEPLSVAVRTSAMRTTSENLLDKYYGYIPWAKSLEAELALTRERYENIFKEWEERGHWGRSLQQALAKERSVVAQMQGRGISVTKPAPLTPEEASELAVARQDLEIAAQLFLKAEREHLERFAELSDALQHSNPDFDKARIVHKEAQFALQIAEQRLHALQSVHDMVIHSLSWRLTKPLRALQRLRQGDMELFSAGLWNQVRPYAEHLPARRVRLRDKAVFTLIRVLHRLLIRHVAYQRWHNAYTSAKAPKLASDSITAKNYKREIAAIEFAECDQPVVSIIIPAYGNLFMTLGALKSIYLHQPSDGFEVIVAEDASGDNKIGQLAAIKGLHYFENPTNLGFIRSCNAAAKLARGQYLFFMNNDAELLPRAIDALVQVFRDHPQAGLVGSKLVYPDGRLQEAGGIIWRDASGWNFGRLQNPQGSEFNYLRETDYCSGAAILVDRALFEQLGRFDELYAPAYYEDTDLAFKVRQAGRLVYYQPESTVVHHEGISHGTDTGAGTKSYQVTNRAKFRERWSGELDRHHFEPGQDLFHARDRSGAKRTVLVVDHYIPQPDRDAGSRSMLHILTALQKMGLNVKFWPHNLYYDVDYAPALQRMGIEVFYHSDRYPSFDAWYEKNHTSIDYVLLSRPHVSLHFIPAIRRFGHAKTLFYGHDIHFKRLAAELELDPSDETVRHSLAFFKNLEPQLWRQMDVIYYPSSSEVDEVQQYLKDNQASGVARNIPVYAFTDFPQLDDDLSTRSGLLFVAGFRHSPNAGAALWFKSEILPLIRAVHPDVKLLLVGSNPPPEVIALADEHTTVTGFVDDDALAGYYASARVAIAPLRFGGGMKGKVVESLRFGLPMVTTSVGMQGFEETEDVLDASDDPEQFARHVIALLSDDALWRERSQRGQAYAKKYFSTDTLIALFKQDMAL